MLQRGRCRERGAAAVEFALVLPLLLLLVGGIVDYGRYFSTQVTLANAAREGARGAVVLADPVARAGAGGMSSSPGWLAPGVTFRNAADVPVTGTGVSCSTPNVTSVGVTARANFRFAFVGVIPGVPANTQIKSEAVMAC
jgi:Flp pilus assembly protein TadG